MRLLILLTCTTLLAGCAVTDILTPRRNEIVVADRLRYAGEDGNAAYVISATFASRRELGEVLNLRTTVGRYNNQNWRLDDILVSIDLNRDGTAAAWTVSGPRPLLTAYGEKLKQLQDRQHLLRELTWHEVEARPEEYYAR
jgi:hypothetical protein